MGRSTYDYVVAAIATNEAPEPTTPYEAGGDSLLTELQSLIGERGEVEIRRVWKPSELPWSCDIHVGENGYGTGNTMAEAIEDAVRDWKEHQ